MFVVPATEALSDALALRLGEIDHPAPDHDHIIDIGSIAPRSAIDHLARPCDTTPNIDTASRDPYSAFEEDAVVYFYLHGQASSRACHGGKAGLRRQHHH
jgi:hypothetical protein